MKKWIGIIASLIFLVDQIIKFFIEKKLNLFQSIEVVKDFFSVTYVRNLGGAFGVFNGEVWFLIAVSFIALMFFIYMIMKEEVINKTMMMIYSFLLGGIIGNLFDRVVRGYVVDYLDFYILGYDYPVFNFADIMIVISVLLLALDLVRSEINENRSRKG